LLSHIIPFSFLVLFLSFVVRLDYLAHLIHLACFAQFSRSHRFITFDFDVLSLSTFNPSPSFHRSTIVRANPYLLSLLSINVVPEKEERQEGEEEGKTAPEHVPMKRRSQTAP
jgi:hypothetical protein